MPFYFPPRPEYKIKSHTLNKYDTGEYFAQIKANGSCGVLELNGSPKLYNRHGELMTNTHQLSFEKLTSPKGKNIFTGEYLNKNKKDANGNSFNHRFLIFDILMYEGKNLFGTTFQERCDLLQTILPCEPCRLTKEGIESDDYLCQTDFENIYRMANFTGGFLKIYNKIIKTDYIEGLVLKRRNAKLSPCFNPSANNGWQLKCRKESTNYNF